MSFSPEQHKKRLRYYRTYPWILRRQAVEDRCQTGGRQYRCERCRLACSRIQVHHWRGYSCLYSEDPETDLRGVCSACHTFLEGIHTFDPRQYAEDWYRSRPNQYPGRTPEDIDRLRWHDPPPPHKFQIPNNPAGTYERRKW